MKKITRLLALVLALALALTMAACGSKSASNSIVGNWKCPLDFDKIIDEMKKEDSGSSDMADVISECFAGLKMTMVLELKEDKTFTMSTDEDSMKIVAERLEERLPDIIFNFAASLSGMTLEQFEDLMTAQGMTREDVLAQFGDTFDADNLLDSMTIQTDTGTYTYENGKLTLTSDEDTAVYAVTLSSSELKFTGVESGEDAIPEALLPLVFTR